MSDRLCTIRAGALPASCVLPILMESSPARGESKNWCAYRCVCSEGARSVVPVHRGWVQGDLGAPIPIPGEPEPRCNRSWGAAGWEPSVGLGHYRTSGSSGIVGCSSLFPSAPWALPTLLLPQFPHRYPCPCCMALADPFFTPPAFGGPPWPVKGESESCFGVKPQRLPLPPAGCGMRVCSAALVFWVPGRSLELLGAAMGRCTPKWV